MTDYKIPDLPSDEELGIAGMDENAPAEPPKPKRTLNWGRKKRGAKPPAEPKASARKASAPRASAPTGGGAWMAPATLFFLLALAWATSPSRVLPRAAPLDAPDSVFSSGRAMLDVVALSVRPRPPGTLEHENARAYLLERLTALGLTPEVQTKTTLRRRGAGLVEAATVRNLVARLPGSGSTGAILLDAHYDSRELSRGAGDDATGVAVILETVRALRAGPPLRNDVIVLLTDAEELGLLGARAFVEDHPWMQDVAVVLSAEMRGGGGPAVMFETGAENGTVVGALDQATLRAYGFSMATEVYRRMPNDTDFTPFREAGKQGLNFAAIGRANVYHQSIDTPERLDERTVQHQGVQVLGVTRVLGDRDLTDVNATDATFFPVPVLGLVVYPTLIGYGVAAGLLVMLLVAAVLLRRASGGAVGVAFGFVGALAIVGITAAAAYFAFPWLAQRHAEYGTLDGSAFHGESWYGAALVALSLGAAVAMLTIVRRRFGLGSLALGAALLPFGLAVAATALAPSSAAALQWAGLFAAAGAAVVAGVGAGFRMGIVRWALLVVLAAGTMVFMVPMVQLVWQSFGFGAAVIVAPLVAMLAVLLLPLLDTFRYAGGIGASVAALLAAVAFGAIGQLQARPSPERPGPSTLLWALDHDSARAVWATLADGGETWAANRTGVALTEERTLAPWRIGGERTYRTGAAPVVTVPRPRVLVTADSAADPGGRRRLTVALSSEIGASVMAVRLPAGDVRLERINGLELPAVDSADRQGSERVQEVVHWGRPEGDLTLELLVGASETSATIEVIEQSFRPELLLGEHWFVRPPWLVPNVAGRSDRLLTRATVSLRPTAPDEAAPVDAGSTVPPVDAGSHGPQPPS